MKKDNWSKTDVKHRQWSSCSPWSKYWLTSFSGKNYVWLCFNIIICELILIRSVWHCTTETRKKGNHLNLWRDTSNSEWSNKGALNRKGINWKRDLCSHNITIAKKLHSGAYDHGGTGNNPIESTFTTASPLTATHSKHVCKLQPRFHYTRGS